MSLAARGVAVLLLFLITRPRGLPARARGWGSVSCLNALVFVILPATAATSPLRPIVGRVILASIGLSVLLVVVGLALWWLHRDEPDERASWTPAFLTAALPAFFGWLLWVIGPVY